MGYGIPDLVSMSLVTPKPQEISRKQREIAQLLENAVRLYEPRLRDVRVEPDPNLEQPSRIRFRLTARLAADRAAEVAFDTMLQLSTGQFIPEGQP